MEEEEEKENEIKDKWQSNLQSKRVMKEIADAEEKRLRAYYGSDHEDLKKIR